jgi:LCP family protein required for cell wall assembly
MTRRALRFLATLAVLGLAAGAAGAGLLALTPLPARANPRMALLKNGYANGVDAGGGLVWVLALGSDARPGEDILHERADSIHLIGVNPDTGAATIIGIPRDSYVPIPGFGNDKINASLTDGGPELVAATVESLTGITAQYTFITTFDGITRMIDRLGGIDITVDVPAHDELSGADFDPGPQHMNGGQALAYGRDRHLTGGDFTRSKHQGDVLLATFDLIKAKGAEPTGFLELSLNFLLDDTITQVPAPEVFRLGRLAMELDPAKVSNCVAYGGVGEAGGASIVVLDSAALQSLVDDVKTDATADQGCPPIPNI